MAWNCVGCASTKGGSLGLLRVLVLVTEEELQLLDATEIDEWGPHLPVRLKEMHSHWHHPAGGIRVLLSPLHF